MFVVCGVCDDAIFRTYSGKVLVLTNLTSNFSGIPLAFAFIVLLGNSGLFTLLFEKWGIDGFFLFPYIDGVGYCSFIFISNCHLRLCLLYPIYYGIQQQWKDAAALLGASTLQFWRKIGIPIMFPGIAGTFSICLRMRWVLMLRPMH